MSRVSFHMYMLLNKKISSLQWMECIAKPELICLTKWNDNSGEYQSEWLDCVWKQKKYYTTNKSGFESKLSQWSRVKALVSKWICSSIHSLHLMHRIELPLPRSKIKKYPHHLRLCEFVASPINLNQLNN